jgi:hypothetical protein
VYGRGTGRRLQALVAVSLDALAGLSTSPVQLQCGLDVRLQRGPGCYLQVAQQPVCLRSCQWTPSQTLVTACPPRSHWPLPLVWPPAPVPAAAHTLTWSTADMLSFNVSMHVTKVTTVSATASADKPPSGFDLRSKPGERSSSEERIVD